jgi:hypothetical protein
MKNLYAAALITRLGAPLGLALLVFGSAPLFGILFGVQSLANATLSFDKPVDATIV